MAAVKRQRVSVTNTASNTPDIRAVDSKSRLLLPKDFANEMVTVNALARTRFASAKRWSCRWMSSHLSRTTSNRSPTATATCLSGYWKTRQNRRPH